MSKRRDIYSKRTGPRYQHGGPSLSTPEAAADGVGILPINLEAIIGASSAMCSWGEWRYGRRIRGAVRFLLDVGAKLAYFGIISLTASGTWREL